MFNRKSFARSVSIGLQQFCSVVIVILTKSKKYYMSFDEHFSNEIIYRAKSELSYPNTSAVA